MENRPQNPFKGLQTYQPDDNLKLFGRDKDLVLIKSRIFSARTTLLFAGSGVGKSSFINAKIIPELKSQFYIHKVNIWSGPATPLDQDKNSQIRAEIVAYLDALKKAKQEQAARRETIEEQAPAAEAQAGAEAPLSGPTLPALLRNFLDLPPDFESRAPSGCLLIFDQFEEIFQRHSYQDGFDTFLSNLSYVINRADLPLRIIFSMRDEFLGELSIFDNRIPDLFNNYYRLKYPDRDDAADIIKRTAKLVNIPVDENNLGQLVRDLSTIEKGRTCLSESAVKESAPTSSFIERDYIVPPYLQISCHKLWQNQFQTKENASDLNRPFLADYQPMEAYKMLRDFFNEKMAALTASERALAFRIFNYLVTKQGAKMAYELKVLAEQMEVDEEKLKPTLLKLSQDDTKILRQTPAPDGSLWFELYHDMYGIFVDEWRADYTKKRHQRNRKYVQIGLASVAVLALLFVAGSILFYRVVTQKAAAGNNLFKQVIRAQDAELEEDRDKAILYRLQYLADAPPDSDEAKDERSKIAGLIGDDYSFLRATYRPSEPTPAVNAIFSADGQMVLTQGSGGGIWLWETETGKPLSRPLKWSVQFTEKKEKAEATESGEQPASQPAPPRRKSKTSLGDAADQEAAKSSTTGSETKSDKSPVRATIKALTGHPQYGLLIAGILNSSADDSGLYIWRADTGDLLGDKPLPLQAAQKRVEGNIIVVNFSPDGRYIATEAAANTPVIREIKENNLNPVPIEGIRHDKYVGYASFSPDSKYLLTGCDDHRAYLWDLSNNSIKFTFRHDHPVKRATFSPDGKRILTRDTDGYLKIWEVETGKQVGRTIHISEREFLRSMLEPDGTTVMTRSYPDSKLSFWDSSSGNRLDAMFNLRESINDANFHPNGKYLLAITGGVARLLQINHVKPAGRLIRDDNELSDYALDPPGKTLMTQSLANVRRWNAEDGKSIGMPAGGQVLSADGGYFMSFDRSKVAQVMDAATGQLFMQLPNVDSDDVDLFVISPDHQYLAFLSKANISLWKNEHQNRPATRIFTDKSGTGNINALAFSMNSQLLLYGGDDKQLRGLSLPTMKPVAFAELNSSMNSPVADVQIGQDGRLALIACGDNQVLLWEIGTGKLLDKVSLGSSVQMVEFSPSGQAALVSTTSWIHRFDITHDTLLHSSSRLLPDKPSSPFRVMDPDGQKIRTLVSHSPGLIQVEDIDFGVELEGPALPGDPKQMLEDWSRKLSLNVERETRGDVKAY